MMGLVELKGNKKKPMEEYQTATRQYNSVHARLIGMKNEKFRVEMVLTELEQPPRHAYVALGKAFVLADTGDLQERLKTKQERLGHDITCLEPMDASLAQKVVDTQAHLVELLKKQ